MIRLILSVSFFFVAVFPGQLPAQEARTAIHGEAGQVQPLLPGMMAPAFTLRDVRGDAVAFDPGSLDKPLVLTFFRGGWCPYCNLPLAELRLAEKELKEYQEMIIERSIDAEAANILKSGTVLGSGKNKKPTNKY